jgi:hypothetical protein
MGVHLLPNGREEVLGPLQRSGHLGLGNQSRRIIGGMP